MAVGLGLSGVRPPEVSTSARCPNIAGKLDVGLNVHAWPGASCRPGCISVAHLAGNTLPAYASCTHVCMNAWSMCRLHTFALMSAVSRLSWC